ncbi:MAG: hypothetical protein E7094_18800 [Bacteroides sp.]|nr:hypothetical protein [Bacteroides sp.]
MGRLKKRDLKKCPEDRNRIRTLEYTHPVLFKIITILIYNKLLVLLLYKVNIKQTLLLLVTK